MQLLKKQLQSGKTGMEEMKTIFQEIPGGSLTFAKAEIDTCKGHIVSSWKIENNKFNLKIEVPAETVVTMPNGEIHEVGAGNWEFSQEI